MPFWRSAILTSLEKAIFIGFLFLTGILTALAARRIVTTIGRGRGSPPWREIPKRIGLVLAKTLTFSTVFSARPVTSLFHGLVGWGFIFYLLVNIGDVLTGFIHDFTFLGEGLFGQLYRLGADVLSVGVLIGMAALMLRRFVVRPDELSVRPATELHPRARMGIRRDSAIVGAFILVHVGARFVGESFHLAAAGPDVWQPLATMLANQWGAWGQGGLEVARHASWWIALGAILAFTPYFLYSKHIHLFFAPLNFLLHPERRSIGELDPLDFDDESIEQFGVSRLEDLSWKGLMDAYACIMCNRCQDACPAYQTGKVLSPAALEINKRYFLNQEGGRIASGQPSSQPMIEFAISREAVWACTACAACVEICPVGNEPMRDILEMRRHQVLMENDFPEQLQTAYRGMERAANPWNIAPEQRLKWAEGLHVPTVEQNPGAEYLWWVGCAPATDPRAQKTAQALARVLNAAGVDFAVLGQRERCTGDSARRSGNEYLFFELASSNVETLNQVAPKRILTTCPHCLHTLKNEYPAFGGEYEVVHHTELLRELIESGQLDLGSGEAQGLVTYHDPCFLGRQNGIVEAPRQVLDEAGLNLTEMPRSKERSFCCGAGGAQMWKEEEQGDLRVSEARLQEAMDTGAKTVAVGCPFCMVMMEDAARSKGDVIKIRDVVELIDENLGS